MQTETQITALPLSRLIPNERNPRTNYNDAAMRELCDSIRQHGVLQPIVARPYDKDIFEIVCGHRRYFAAQEVGLEAIPARVWSMTGPEADDIAMVENLQREDLTPIDEARGYHQLINNGSTVAEIAGNVHRSRAHVAGRLALLDLPGMTIGAIEDGRISLAVAGEIARLAGQNQRLEATEMVLKAAHSEYDVDVGDDLRPAAAPCSLAKARKLIRERFLLDLTAAPFDVNDANLIDTAGPCAACPSRTGNRVDLFGDLEPEDGGADVCTYLPCFEMKTDAHRDRLLAEAKAAGMAIVPAKQVEKLFTGGGDLSWNAQYVLCDGAARDPKTGRTSKKTLEKMLGKDAPTVHAAVSPTGKLVRLYRANEAVAALSKKAGDSKSPESEEQRRTQDTNSAYAKRAAANRAALDAVMAKIADAAGGNWEALEYMVMRELVVAVDSSDVLERRNVEEGVEAEDIYLCSLDSAGRKGLIAEILLRDVVFAAVRGGATDHIQSQVELLENACDFSLIDELRLAREAAGVEDDQDGEEDDCDDDYDQDDGADDDEADDDSDDE